MEGIGVTGKRCRGSIRGDGNSLKLSGCDYTKEHWILYMWNRWIPSYVKYISIMLSLRKSLCAWPGGSVGWTSSCALKGCQFRPWSRHMPGLWLDPQSRHVQKATSRCFSYKCFSLSHSLSLSKHILRWGLKKSHWDFHWDCTGIYRSIWRKQYLYNTDFSNTI